MAPRRRCLRQIYTLLLLLSFSVLGAEVARAAEGAVTFTLQQAQSIDFVRAYVGLAPKVYEVQVDLMGANVGRDGRGMITNPTLARVLSEPRIYYVALTSVDTQGRESAFSNEITLDLRQPNAAPPPPRMDPSSGNPSGGGGGPMTGPRPTNPTGPMGPTGGGPNPGPSLFVQVEGVRTAGPFDVPGGIPIRLRAVASDPDGLGFPLFSAFGSSQPITYVWTFGGATTTDPGAALSDSPTVTFPLGASQSDRSYTVTVTAFDALGAQTKQTVSIRAVTTTAPELKLFANGNRIDESSAPIRIRSGDRVFFNVQARDPDGLGFPVFRALGIDSPIVYLWSFGSGVPDNDLSVFTPDPRPRFRLPNGVDALRETVQVVVFDSKGAAASKQVVIEVRR